MSAISSATSASTQINGANLLSNTGLITVNGLASNLNTDQIITALLATDQAQIQLLQNRENKFSQKRTAFQQIEASLLDLQGQIQQLRRSQNGVFDSLTVASSDESLVTAAASGKARPGVYSLAVNGLARAQIVASQGFDSASGSITQGTIQLRVGAGALTTIIVDGTNNTLQGLADAINASGAGITANIVNDGSGQNSQAYRLLLSANQGGTANAISIVNNLSADSGPAVKPVLDAAYVGRATIDSGFTGTATPTANTGTGGYTGDANNLYTFTVVSGGTVGTDNNIQVAYSDSTGAHTGTLTLNSGDVNTFKSVAQGIQVEFGSGTLVAGQTFSVKAFVPNVQQAANASITLGSGAGALIVQSSTNQVNDAIPGVTLNLNGSDPSKQVTLAIGNDTQKALKAIQDFVASFNKLSDAIDNLTSFDPNTNTAGILLGDQTLENIQDQVRGIIAGVVGGINQNVNRLSALGITLDDHGHLNIDQARLSAALSGQVSGAALSDVRSLFALAGSAANSGLQFVTGSDRTRGSASGYQVDITQAATQAAIAAATGLAASTVIDNTNNTLSLTVDGQTANVTLASGTYTAQALAQELQAEINSTSALTGRQVSVGLSGGQLTITSKSFGSSSQVQIGGGTAVNVLGFTGTESSKGTDVIGNYIVNGIIEPATGSGQFLVGNATNANTADLQIRVTLNQSQVVSGPEGSVNVTRGIAAQFSTLLDRLLDPVTGRLKTVDDGFKQTIDDIQGQITRQNALMEQHRQSLAAQFVALESSISQLQSISGLLTNQLAGLTTNTGKTSK